VRSLIRLAARTWRHPITGEPARFSVVTLERWYYRARKERQDPVGVLRSKRRSDAGCQGALRRPRLAGACGPGSRQPQRQRRYGIHAQAKSSGRRVATNDSVRCIAEVVKSDAPMYHRH